MLSSIIHNSFWCWPPIQCRDFMEMLLLSQVLMINLSGIKGVYRNFFGHQKKEDKPLWIPSNSRLFNIRDTWNRLRNEHLKITWYQLVWLKEAIPKQSFICWLYFFDRLSTRVHQHKRKISLDPYCALCGLEESSDHLFFKCVFSSQVWISVMLRTGKAFNFFMDSAS